MIVTEAVVTTAQAAVDAQRAGVSRIELCQHLEVGGITPSLGTLIASRNKTTFPIHVLIRPRRGNFVYSPIELEVMVHDIKAAVRYGANAVVIGALTPNREIDLEATQEMLEAAGNASVTFHRAFDEVADPKIALEQLVQLGIDRVLTSGQQPTALEGTVTLQSLVEQSAGRIAILPGSGINAGNAIQILQQTGAQELHFSAVAKQANGSNALSMGKGDVSEEGQIEVFDGIKASDLLAELRKLNQ